MANGQEVRLTFAGDADQLTRAMERVGQSAQDMSSKVDDAGAGFDAAAEGFDKAEQRATGFRDTITGVQDSVAGFSAVLKGDFSGEALLTAGAGVGDLASGFANFLVPSLKNAVTWFKATKLGMLAQAAAAKVVTAGQWLLNAAMSANPITLIIIAIVALIAIFVLLWNKCSWFRDFWIGLWDLIKGAAEAVGNWFVDTLWHGILEPAFNWIGDGIDKVWQWFKDLPTKIKDAFVGLVDIILWPYKTAFNLISDAWNNTVGKLSWNVPSWVPFIGGKTISAPHLPHFHAGGIVPGTPGQEMLAVLQAGERVLPANQSGGSGTTIVLRSDGRRAGDLLLQLFAEALQGQGLKVVTR